MCYLFIDLDHLSKGRVRNLVFQSLHFLVQYLNLRFFDSQYFACSLAVLLDDVPMINEKVVLLYPLMHHFDGSAFTIVALGLIFYNFLGLRPYFIQLLLILHHQKLTFDNLQLLGNRHIDDPLHRLNHGNFSLLLDFDRSVDKLFGVHVVPPTLGDVGLKLSLLFDKLFIVLSFDHNYFNIK